MGRIIWDGVGERRFETGVDHGVLYPAVNGAYPKGVAWNGLTAVTESPSGAEASPQYADNIKYLNLMSAEEFGGTIEAFTYPDEFEACDGSAELSPGVLVGQQSRKPFGLSYRTLVGNDVDGTDHGYKLHLAYGALASPSEKSRSTVNDSPEAVGFSWDFSTTPVAIGKIAGKDYKPSATLTIDSTKVDADALAALEDILYGTEGSDPRLPLPAEVVALFAGTIIEATPAVPTQAGNVVTIPTTTGVEYTIDGNVVVGTYTLTTDKMVTARPKPGYVFPDVVDVDWLFKHS